MSLSRVLEALSKPTAYAIVAAAESELHIFSFTSQPFIVVSIRASPNERYLPRSDCGPIVGQRALRLRLLRDGRF